MDFKLNKSNLNFRVYTASAVPSVGNENDIVVISDAPMKNWVMSPDAPKGVPRNDGDVWITYSVTGNTFNALRNSTMLIATISAWQYIDGSWVDKSAKSYQNSAWADWRTYLFEEGTGAKVEFVNTSGYMKVSEDGIACSGTKSDGLYTAAAITLSRPATFYVEATITTVGTSADYIGSLVAKTSEAFSSTRNDYPTKATVRVQMTADGVRTVYEMSLEPGTWHLGISGNVKGTVHKMWYV